MGFTGAMSAHLSLSVLVDSDLSSYLPVFIQYVTAGNSHAPLRPAAAHGCRRHRQGQVLDEHSKPRFYTAHVNEKVSRCEQVKPEQ